MFENSVKIKLLHIPIFTRVDPSKSSTGHVLEKNTRNLYTFFSFLFQQKIRPQGRLYGRHFVFNAYPGRNATCPLSSCSNKNNGPRGRFNCISTVSCKGSVCVEVLTSFYGRFFVEGGQFIKYTPST